MSLKSHPSPDLIDDFTKGELPLAPGVTVSAHLETCPACSARVARVEESEGRKLEASPDVALAGDALAQSLARIDSTPIPHEAAQAQHRLADIDIPRAAARAGLGPRRWLAPGFWAAAVTAPTAEGWRTFLLRAPSGATIPSHVHGGRELMAVLRGGLADGGTYVAGDFADNPAGSDHRLTVSQGGPCACLISVQGPVKWRGWAKLLMPALGI